MDEHNVHHFWGISPALDLGSLLPSGSGGPAALPVDQPIRMLQVAPYDARHTITTLCLAARHPLLLQQPQPVQLVVWEDSPEGLARHLLLLAMVLDGSLLPRERMELLLELHGNALLRERAAAYLDEKARQLEAMVVELAGGGARGGGGGSGSPVDDASPSLESRGLGLLGRMLDLSLLKFQEKDLLVEALQKWRTTVVYDMVKAWDARARKWYGDRYDFRRNLVDWDYHMRLQVAGTPGQDPAHGSIIHFHHFRHWRMHGIAHELRDSHYNQPNRSLLSTAYGRTREFKDRSGRDVGRSVSAWGFWADGLNGPFHCFGTLTDEPSFYKITNKQFARTALDVAEHNVKALLHELRTGEPLRLAEGAEAPRARAARGPTSLEDLTGGQQPGGQGQQEQEGKQEGTGGKGEGKGEGAGNLPPPPAPPPPPPPSPPPPPTDEGTGVEPSAADGSTPDAAVPAGSASAEATKAEATRPEEGTELGRDSAGAAAAAAPRYTSGGRGAVAAAMAAAATAAVGTGMAEGVGPAPGLSNGGSGVASTQAASEAHQHQQQQSDEEARAGGQACAAVAAGTSNDSEAVRQKMAAEEAALRAAEAALDAAARARLEGRFRLVLATGDLAKGVTGRAKFAGAFSALTLGHRHVHMLGPEYGLFKAAAPGAVLVAENARHVLQLNKEQAALFVTKMDEMAAAAGWRKAAHRPPGVTEASEVYDKPLA